MQIEGIAHPVCASEICAQTTTSTKTTLAATNILSAAMLVTSRVHSINLSWFRCIDNCIETWTHPVVTLCHLAHTYHYEPWTNTQKGEIMSKHQLHGLHMLRLLHFIGPVMLLTVPPDRLCWEKWSPWTVCPWISCPPDCPCPIQAVPPSIFALDSGLVIMMHMAVRHTNADGIFTKASHSPGPFVPGIDGPPLKSETGKMQKAECGMEWNVEWNMECAYNIPFNDQNYPITNYPVPVYCNTCIAYTQI